MTSFFSNVSNPYGITDRIRFTVIKVNSDEILSRDLIVMEPEVIINLSAPSRSAFKIPQTEQYASASGIQWKTWGQWIVPEIEIAGVRKCLGAQIVNRVDIDPEKGDLSIEAIGFMGYPKGIPWLENYNPIAVDPAEVIQKIWGHCQDFTNANLGVNVLPATTGTQMLPGYSFDGNNLVFDFFAMFIREVDFQDCGDVINNLARDMPLDMIEEVSWDTSRNSLSKILRLGYPNLGLRQESLSFVMGENVIAGEKMDDLDIEPVTDVIIRSWRPGKAVSSRLNVEAMQGASGALAHVDPMSRLRRVSMEEDVGIDSTERAAAWARRKLTRRNIPDSFKKIMIDPSHPNAPLGSFGLGDSIYVEARDYPWVGTIEGWHRIMSMTFKESEPIVELGLKVEGAFNYDQIYYNPNWEEQVQEDKNMLINGYFTKNQIGWKQISGQWFRVASFGRANIGSMRVDCDDASGEFFESQKVGVTAGASYLLEAWVRRQEIIPRAGQTPDIYIAVQGYLDGAAVTERIKVASLPYPEGTGGWTKLSGWATMPGLDENGKPVLNDITLTFCVTGTQDGITWWDDARIERL